MSKAFAWFNEYKKGIAIGATMLLIGFLFGQAKVYVGIPERLNRFDERLRKVENDHAELKISQEKINEHQDIETRLNTAEINGLKIEITAIGAATETNTKLLEEMRSDIKRLLQRD